MRLYFETIYKDPESGEKYGARVCTESIDDLEPTLAARGMGETVHEGPSRQPQFDKLQRASKLLRRAARLVERLPEKAKPRDHVSDLIDITDMFNDCHHAGVFCAMIADRSGIAHVGAMVRDGGLLHEMCHVLFRPAQLRRDRQNQARMIRRLASRWAKFERRLPGLIP